MRQRQKKNWRVEIEPEPAIWDRDPAARDEAACRRIHQAILRHVDEVGSVVVKWDMFYVCEFCGDHSDDAAFVECCDKAIEEVRTTEGDGE